MRSNSIISILRKRRALRRRTSRRIKYAEALQMLKAYENGELRLDRMIDNVLNPSKSISNHCTIDGCGRSIRYEYVLVSKVTDDRIIAGSTCVWIMLGMSEEQIKDFGKIESTIKEFHEMLIWRKTNMDVWNKLGELKAANLDWFRPFWEEVEFSKLHPEDEEYIRNINVDDEIKYDADRKARRAAMPAKTKRTRGPNRVKAQTVSQPVVAVSQPVTPSVISTPVVVSQPSTGRNAFEAALIELKNSVTPPTKAHVEKPTIQEIFKMDSEEYKKIMGALNSLVTKYPQNTALISIKAQSDSGKMLTENQIHKVKVEINNEYFVTKIKGTPAESEYNVCDKDVKELFTALVNSKEINVYTMDLDMLTSSKIDGMINKYKRQFNEKVSAGADERMKTFWKYFRIKHQIILK